MALRGSNSEEVEFQPSQTAAPLLPNIHYFYYSAIMLLNLLLLTIHYFGVHCRRVPAPAAKLLWNAAIRLQQWLAGRQTDNFSKIERKETGRHVSKSNLTHIQGELWSTVSGHWGQLMQNRMCWQYNRGRMCRQCGKGSNAMLSASHCWIELTQLACGVTCLQIVNTHRFHIIGFWSVSLPNVSFTLCPSS